ncbi:MAG: DUF3768 domain-containing protein [Bacteroidota bacterium]
MSTTLANGQNGNKSDRQRKIAELNDDYRLHRPLSGGKLVITRGVLSLGYKDAIQISEYVRTFDNFTKDNDPYGEHDFGSFIHKGQQIFWKIDYYDLNFEYGSEDPADETKTRRVLTIMLASEY